MKLLKNIKLDEADSILALRISAMGEIGIIKVNPMEKKFASSIYLANKKEALKFITELKKFLEKRIIRRKKK